MRPSRSRRIRGASTALLLLAAASALAQGAPPLATPDPVESSSDAREAGPASTAPESAPAGDPADGVVGSPEAGEPQDPTAAITAADAATPTVPAPDAAAKRSVEIERMGATISAVNLTIDNVFDPNDPKENKRLYRWANRIHVPTRMGAIQSALLFEIGDPYTAHAAEETARMLRQRGYLAEASVTPGRYDAATNTVEVDVHVRDSWTLAPDLKFSHHGGQSEWGVGLEDRNLLGTGKQLTATYKSLVDRDETLLSYGDNNVFGSHVRLNATLANASDGHRRVLAAERPFYSLDSTWMLGGAIQDANRVDPMYDLGEKVDEFEHDIQDFSFQGGWSSGFVDNGVKRWLVGIASEEDTFTPTPETPQPLFLPEDRKFVYPWLGWQLIRNDFREMSDLNDIGRTEDVALGAQAFLSVGFATKSLGSDRNATLYRGTYQRGWEPGGHLFMLSAGASTRDEQDGWKNSILEAGARYYLRQSENRLLSISLGVTLTDELDGDVQVLLGGDNGLRGYPLRYQAGEQRQILNIEERFFTDLYPWRLFRVGWAAFLDVGRVSGTDPRASPSLGTLYDVGVGLRLSSPRASGKSVVHVDLAFPLNGDPTIDTVQFVVETKSSF